MKEESERKKISESSQFRLAKYYYTIEISTLAVIALIWAFIYFSPYFEWVRYPRLLLADFFFVFFVNLLFFLLYLAFKLKFLFNVTRYSFIVFFFVCVYATGGAASSLVITFIFPIIVSTVDLNPVMTKRVGIIVGVLFALMIFLDKPYLNDMEIIVRHILNVTFYSIMALYLYRIVKETISQKFEKDEAKRKLFEIMEVDKLKTDFVTVASHQLRTPLSGAAWGLDNILSDTSLSDKVKRLIKESYERIKKANQIVTEMLQAIDISRPGSNINAEKVDLAVIVKEVIDELHYLIVRKGVKIETSAIGEVILEADQKLLKAGITNIIDNAIRYSPKGMVNISLIGDGENVKLIIKDNGSGISEEDMPYMFGKFFRGKNGLEIDPNESGVGLYVTKKIIELHGGTINLKSEVGKGTELSVLLPIKLKTEKRRKVNSAERQNF